MDIIPETKQETAADTNTAFFEGSLQKCWPFFSARSQSYLMSWSNDAVIYVEMKKVPNFIDYLFNVRRDLVQYVFEYDFSGKEDILVVLKRCRDFL